MLQHVEIAEFTARHAVRDPHPRPDDAHDAHRLLSTDDGVAFMPCAGTMTPAPRPGDPDSRHLWVIREASLPVILETAPEVRPPPLSLAVAKHTNLTGGGPAACGGEVWVDEVDQDKLFVNGGSGRYPARSAEELMNAENVFREFGYTVVGAGWSEENDWPQRVFR